MATKEFKEELKSETATNTRKKTDQEEMVDIYVDFANDGDESPLFISVANEEMDRTFLLRRGEYMSVPKIVADEYNSYRQRLAEARRRQAALQNKEIATNW